MKETDGVLVLNTFIEMKDVPDNKTRNHMCVKRK